MILATAGHVDHGKTSLIAALTGADTDRLPEEKKRGLSIDLGFAYLKSGQGEPIGFIDVPGHEKFIRNMIAGVAGIDVAVLVVAADDGAMPQTKEHLAILSLLGIRSIVVAITKTDLVEADRIDAVRRQTAELIAVAKLDTLGMYAVSTQTGDGIDGLRQALLKLAEQRQHRRREGHFRLAVDRSFSVSGAGTVVTGTVFAGSVELEQTVHLLSSASAFRVRTIHAQNQSANVAVAGQRCALNLAGAAVRNAQFNRGDWITAAPDHRPVRTLDVLVTPSPFLKELQHWTAAHLHLGAADIPCRIALLSGETLGAGISGYARLICDRELGAVHGDQLVLRDQSARNTIAGGRVVDPLPPARGRARPERIALLDRLAAADRQLAIKGALDVLVGGIDLAEYGARFNVTDDEWNDYASDWNLVVCGRLPHAFGVAAQHWDTVLEQVRLAIANWHQQYPDILGAGEFQLIRRLSPRLSGAVLAEVLQTLIQQKIILKKGAVYCLADWRIRLQGEDQRLWEQILPVFSRAGVRAPRVVELAEIADAEASEIERLLNQVVACGLLYRVSRNRYYLPDTLLRLAAFAEQLAAGDNLTVASFRDASGIGRNLSVEMLEFFDSCRLTRRVGETRQLLQAPMQCFGDS